MTGYNSRIRALILFEKHCWPRTHTSANFSTLECKFANTPPKISFSIGAWRIESFYARGNNSEPGTCWCAGRATFPSCHQIGTLLSRLVETALKVAWHQNQHWHRLFLMHEAPHSKSMVHAAKYSSIILTRTQTFLWCDTFYFISSVSNSHNFRRVGLPHLLPHCRIFISCFMYHYNVAFMFRQIRHDGFVCPFRILDLFHKPFGRDTGSFFLGYWVQDLLCV